MQDDLEGLRIRRQDYQLADAPVQRFCGLVGSLFYLLDAGALFDHPQYFGGQFLVGLWRCSLCWILKSVRPGLPPPYHFNKLLSVFKILDLDKLGEENSTKF